jgi:hypothetical protein
MRVKNDDEWIEIVDIKEEGHWGSSSSSSRTTQHARCFFAADDARFVRDDIFTFLEKLLLRCRHKYLPPRP